MSNKFENQTARIVGGFNSRFVVSFATNLGNEEYSLSRTGEFLTSINYGDKNSFPDQLFGYRKFERGG